MVRISVTLMVSCYFVDKNLLIVTNKLCYIIKIAAINYYGRFVNMNETIALFWAIYYLE